MKKLLIIFKGWSSPSDLYKKLREVYKDFKIIYNDEMDRIEIGKYGKVSLFAWSMGTLDAIEYDRKHEVDEMILVSPTLNFTSDTRPIILKKMIKRLDTDREGCLKDFTALCFDTKGEAMRYWNEYKKEILKIDNRILIEGLVKLIEKKLTDKISQTDVLIITAKNDRVISNKNSMVAAENYPNGRVIELDGGHNLFYDKIDELLETIKEYRGGRDATLKV